MTNIVITRKDGGIRVSPAPPYIVDYLHYSHRSFQVINYRRVNKFEKRLLHRADDEGGIITFQGFFEKICSLILKNHDTYQVEDLRTPLPEIDWERIKAIGLREYQIDPYTELLVKARSNPGVISAPGGYGKTIAQMVTYAAFHRLNTIVAIPLAQVFKQTFNKFIEYFPEKVVGRVGDGHNTVSTDITISTFKSLPKCALEKCELLLVDEIQGTTGDVISDVLKDLKPIRMFGYTATDRNLFNNGDKLIKGLFGERLIHIEYQEAEDVKAVVPGIVYFLDMPDGPRVDAATIPGKISQGIERCERRNELIGRVCAAVPNKWQTLVFVDHIATHLVNLMPFMPSGTKYVHRMTPKTEDENDTNKQKELNKFGLNKKQQNETIAAYENNEFQYLVATDAFRAGVDLPNCRVVVQASGGSSEIELLQEAFRGSRTLTPEYMKRLDVEPKTHFVLIDIMDSHDDRLEGMAMKRMEIYRSQGWTIHRVREVEDIDWFDYKKIKTLT